MTYNTAAATIAPAICTTMYGSRCAAGNRPPAHNPTVTAERQFDVKVEYHFFRKGTEGRGEQYFNHTEPQRFNPALMGSGFDAASGDPVMAGQVVPLAGFQEGEYRLGVQVLDLLSGKSISRDVFFTVGS